MQPNKTKIALVIGAFFLGASGASNAATANFDITVSTLPDVVLSQVQALDYGANMFVTALGTCTMNAVQPGEGALMQYQSGTTEGATASSNFGTLTGGGCVNGTEVATPGVYKIAGLAGTTVNITINGVSNADFGFNPNSGCIVNFDGGATLLDSQDSCDAFVPGAITSTDLPAVTATEEGSAAPGFVVSAAGAAELHFTVGGTVTIGAVDLSANTNYVQQFPVDVVY